MRRTRAFVPSTHDERPVEVVVLGGGYVAVWGYRAMVRRLRRHLRDDRVRITVVSGSPAHAFHGWTGEVLAGLVRHDHTRTPLDDLLPHARVLQGWATAVDPAGQTVTVAMADGTRDVAYDHLLVAVGSRDALDLPGLADHGVRVKGHDDLATTVAHLDDVVARAATTTDHDERRRLLTVVVAGGGFAGVEMAAAINERLQAMRATTPVLAAAVPRVMLVHSRGHLLDEIRPRFNGLADYATRQLVDAGVQVRLGTRLEAVSDHGAVLDDGVVPSATVVATMGQAMVPLPGTEALARTTGGRFDTDAWLRTSHHGIWAGGDTAAVPHVLRGTPCPPNALWALKQGTRAGDNISRSIRGRGLRRFRYLGLGQAASLGVGRGAVELYGVTLTGWPGWLARWGFFHAFMPSRRVALATIRDWQAIRRRGRFLPTAVFDIEDGDDHGGDAATTASNERGHEVLAA